MEHYTIVGFSFEAKMEMIDDDIRMFDDGFYTIIWIGSSYFSFILVLFRWKKLEESTCRAILVAGSSLENWGPKPSRPILRNLMEFLGLQCLKIVHTPFMVFYTSKPF
jgi:hypothetical protein